MTTMSPFGLVEADLERVREALNGVGEGDNALLVETIRHLFGARGKYVRPSLALIGGRLFEPRASERLVNFATAVEVIHTASLVHDDTLDSAGTRRGTTTVNAGWNGHIAILVGDYLFAQAALITAALDDLRVMSMVADTIKSLVRGELLQMETTYKWEQHEDEYEAKIANKTASLFALPTAGAAVLAGRSEGEIAALRHYGYNLGMAFQIMDDILDVTEKDDVLGKPAGSDLAQGTITLPVLYYLQQAAPEERAIVIDGARPEEAVALVAGSSAIDRTRVRADAFIDEALEALEGLPRSEARVALQEIAQFVVERTH